MRFLRSRRRSLARFTAAAAVLGIAAGVASLIVAQALGRGFQAEMRDRVIGHNAHVSVFRNDGSVIGHADELMGRIRGSNGVKRVDATVYESVVLTGPNGSSHAVLRVWFDDSLGDDAVSVGSHLARRLGIETGDHAAIATIGSGLVGPSAQMAVRSILKTGLYDYDSTWIAITEDGYRKNFGAGGFAPTVLNVSANDPGDAQAIAGMIDGMLDENFTVLSWQDANRPLFAAMTLERRVAGVVMLLIILIAALNITTTLALLVSERRVDIAVLRSCGAKTKCLLTVFLTQGVVLCAAGIAAGLVLGHAACFVLNRYELISLPEEVYSISSVALRPAITDSAFAAAGALAIGLLASIYPAYRGSQVKPLDNLRV